MHLVKLNLFSFQTFVYVSTAYCCNEVPHVEEKLYDMNVNPHNLLQAIDTLSEAVINKVTKE